ncbi:MATE family efflux transporter [Halovivax sp.]|uniref:MATE family efflux transporter n=1 Tax=Halovivax sp. TaxID=1935978 RepID=UPI0025C1387E|nr:MATE family efflux transporter [Halovivax sp.]
MESRTRRAVAVAAGVLDRVGVIEEDRFRPTMGLAWPRIVTGFAIMSKQVADLAMVGWAVGTAAVAGLAFAYAYWQVAKYLSIGLAGGTISLVSQNYGGGASERAELVVKQSSVAAVAMAVPIVAAYVLFAEPLIAVFGGEAESIRHGAVYLVVVAPALLFEFQNLIASRTYAAVGDTYTPMVVRAGGGIANIALSGAFIFGLGLGVAGAALGTAIATAVVTVALAWGMVGRSYGGGRLAPCPVRFRFSGPYLDAELSRQLVAVSAPLMGRRLAQMAVVFPLLWIAAAFGPVVVAAFEVGRRVRDLINSFNWGLSIASSTLVGQHLGAGAEREAEGYGADIIRLTTVLYLLVGLAVIALATPIARVFVSTPTEVDRAATFVQVAAISAVAMGVDGAATGALRGAGDTRWPFVASLVGRYAVALPVAALGLVTPLAVVGLYLALFLETLVPAAINLWRFRSNRWKAVSREYRPTTDPG